MRQDAKVAKKGNVMFGWVKHFLSKADRPDTPNVTAHLPENRLLMFPQVDSEEHYLRAFWCWISILAADDYQHALEALHWPEGTGWTAQEFESRIKTFWGGDEPWYVVVPNDRLIGVINNAAEIQLRTHHDPGWMMAQIPLTTEPEDPKNDQIPFMGLAISLFIRPKGNQYVFEFEMFHL